MVCLCRTSRPASRRTTSSRSEVAPVQAIGRQINLAQRLLLPGGERRAPVPPRMPQQHRRKALERSQGIAQFVGYEAEKLILEAPGLLEGRDVLHDHQRCWLPRGEGRGLPARREPRQQAPIQGHGVHQHGQACAVGVTNELLVVKHGPALLQRAQGSEGGRWERLAIGIKEVNVVSGQKVQQGLADRPLAAPQRHGGAISKHQARLGARHEVHAGG
jgi:hypothetical protein